ncbi:MAG TPA: flagellar motor switch protein FliN [archaeon]|nr:flagellar motor switch protein FliN [archaeon]
MSNFTMTPEEAKALQEFAGIVAEESGVVMSTLLDKKIDIKVESTAAADQGKLSADFPESIVVVECSFATGFDEKNYFLFNKSMVSKLSDLMMMGDGTAEFSEDHIDAIQEGVNQMMGAAATALSTRLNKTVDFQPSHSQVAALDEAGLDLDNLTTANFELQIEGASEGKISMLISYPVIKEVAAAFGTAPAAGEEVGGEAESDLGMEMAGFEAPEAKEPESFAPSAGDQFDSLARVGLLEKTKLGSKEHERLELLLDLKLDISIELGRTRMLVRDILELGPGSVIELDKMAGETVDLLINDKKLAEGEVVVVDENFGIRVTHLISMEERIKMLQTS